jgi:hypothetical protein
MLYIKRYYMCFTKKKIKKMCSIIFQLALSDYFLPTTLWTSSTHSLWTLKPHILPKTYFSSNTRIHLLTHSLTFTYAKNPKIPNCFSITSKPFLVLSHKTLTTNLKPKTQRIETLHPSTLTNPITTLISLFLSQYHIHVN